MLTVLAGRLCVVSHHSLLHPGLGRVLSVLQVSAAAAKVSQVPEVLETCQVLAENVCEVFHVEDCEVAAILLET